MSDFDLPPVPSYQLQTPALTAPTWQPPWQAPLTPSFSTAPGTGVGGGSSVALMAALGHLTDGPLAPTAGSPLPAMPAPSPGGLPPITGSGFIAQQAAGFLNPWLASPMAVAEEEQRRINMMPQVDPGVAAQQTILKSPTFTF